MNHGTLNQAAQTILNAAASLSREASKTSTPEYLTIKEACAIAKVTRWTIYRWLRMKDANGEYYLVVPRGGGVMLSVQLARIPRPTPPDPEEDEEKATESIVVFNLNGGTLDGKTGSITVEARIGEKFELLGAPEREGYDFVGWNVQEVAQDMERSGLADCGIYNIGRRFYCLFMGIPSA